MSHGPEKLDHPDRQAMPPIQGVRPAQSFAGAVTPFDEKPISPAPDEPATDPWGAGDPTDSSPAQEPELAADQDPAAMHRGGGILTIPLLCIGVAIIACVSLLPLADENHQLAWEREKLKTDLAQLKEQGRVNGEFLQRVADDPTLAERLAQRQMRYIREGSSVLNLRGGGKEEMSPFHLVSVPPPPPLPPYEPVGGALATLVRQPRAQLYLCGLALLFIAAGLVLGYVPKSKPQDIE